MEKEMENLKSVDLMLGDYVICHHPTKPQEIVNVTSGLLSIIERQENGIIDNNSPLYRVVKPIPITKEILEINGYKEKMGGTFEFVFNEKEAYIKMEYNPVSGHISANYHWFIANEIYFVHELQHALKMSKVDKEIEL